MALSSRTHGILDYTVSLALILSPKLLNLDSGSAEGQVPVALGLGSLVYSLITRYELSLFKLLPFRVHLGLDVMSGLVLALSPWIFGFADRVWAPHLILGALEVGVVAMTRKTEVPLAHVR